MKKLYSISIHSKYSNVLYLEQTKNSYKVINNTSIENEKLKEFLKDKSPYYIVVYLDEILDEIITTPSVIKTHNALYGYVLKKFGSTLPTKDILLNYQKISQDSENKTITYKIDAINQKEYLKYMQLIPSWEDIKSATIEKFAFFAIVRQCFQPKKNEGYFAVYTYANTLTALAIDDNGKIVFDRLSNVYKDDTTSVNINLTNEISQTVSYVKQQYKNINFNTIILAGSLSLDDEASQHLHFITNINIAVIYPNSFIEGFEAEEAQEHIMALGSLFVEKRFVFLPNIVKNLKQYKLAQNSLLAVSVIFLIYFLSICTNSFINYFDELDRYENIKKRLLHLIKTTDTYTYDELKKSYIHLKIAEKYLKNSPVDLFLELKPLLELQKPSVFSYDDSEAKEPVISITFEKKFEKLNDLYNFEKRFSDIFEEINKNKRYTITKKTDYTKLNFMVEISTEKETKLQQPARRIE